MYYEEQIIDGVLCWRNSPRGEWTKRTIGELSTQVAALQARLSLAEKVVEAAEARKSAIHALAYAVKKDDTDAACAAIVEADKDIWSTTAAYRSAK